MTEVLRLVRIGIFGTIAAIARSQLPDRGRLFSSAAVVPRRLAPAPTAEVRGIEQADAVVPAQYQRIAARLEFGAISVVLSVLAWHLWSFNSAPIVYSDSGTALSISLRLARGDVNPLWYTQSPPLQDGMYALLLWAGLPGLLHAPVLLASFALALLLGWIAVRATRQRVAFALPALVLLFTPVFWIQSANLPFYTVFVLLAYAGLYLGLGYVHDGTREWRGMLGGMLIAASLYAFTLALIFLFVPALFLVLFANRHRIMRTAVLYAAMTAGVAPWLAWHISVGGIEHIHYHPLDWFTLKYQGYVHPLFWGNGEDLSTFAYARALFDILRSELIVSWIAPLVLLGFLYVRRRFGTQAMLFCVACIALHLVALLVTQPATHARYQFPIVPLFVLLASAGAYWLLIALTTVLRDPHTNTRRSVRPLVVVVCAIMAVVAVSSMNTSLASVHRHYVDRLENDKVYADLRAMAPIVQQSDKGIIARDSAMQALVPENQVYTHFLLTEQEYVTYLAWNDDGEVAETLRAHDIGWVLIRNNPLRWELNYNVWLKPSHGMTPQHYVRVKESPLFELAYEGPAYELYRLK